MKDQKTLIISRKDIEKIFTMEDTIKTVEMAFKLYGEKKVQMPPKVYVNFEKGDFRVMPAYIPDLNAAGIKTVNVHPNNTDFPSVMGTLTLLDPETGFPMAIMDATLITKMRTGAAGGIASKYLSKEDSEVAGFIGAGIQAESQVDAIMITKPDIKKIMISDPNTENAERFKKYCEDNHGVETKICETIAEVTKESDIITTTTPVRKPIVMCNDVKPGAHINAIGADAEGKEELDPEILNSGRIIIDNWDQASHSGEINVPCHDGIVTKDCIFADIGEIVSGKKNARDDDKVVTVFDSTGLAIQDISCAIAVYNKIIADPALLETIQKVNLI